MHVQTRVVSLEPAGHVSRPHTRSNAPLTPCVRGLCHGIPARFLPARTGRSGTVVPDALEAVAIGACGSWLPLRSGARMRSIGFDCSASPNKPTPLQPCCRDVALACTPAAVTLALCAQDGFAPYRGIAQVTYGWGLTAQGEAAPGLALRPQGLVAGRRVRRVTPLLSGAAGRSRCAAGAAGGGAGRAGGRAGDDRGLWGVLVCGGGAPAVRHLAHAGRDTHGPIGSWGTPGLSPCTVLRGSGGASVPGVAHGPAPGGHIPGAAGGAEPGAGVQPPGQAKHLTGRMEIPIAIAPGNVLGMFMVGAPTRQVAR